MGPGGGVGDVRVIDGFGGLPDSEKPAPQQPVATKQQPVVTGQKPALVTVRDGFGSFQQPELPSLPLKGKGNKVFFVAIKWFTDGLIETVRETFSWLGLFKPAETFEISRAAYYYDKKIMVADGYGAPDVALNEGAPYDGENTAVGGNGDLDVLLSEGAPVDEVVGAVQSGGVGAFVPGTGTIVPNTFFGLALVF